MLLPLYKIFIFCCYIFFAVISFFPNLQAVEIRFAAIGDYGYSSSNEQAVANMIKGWGVDFIITAGDNSYGSNSIDINVGQYYSDFIGNYFGEFGFGSNVNRYFPSLGNHDYSDGGGITAYLEYFTLPGVSVNSTLSSGNERYYDFQMGPVHFFAINSCQNEPNGINDSSIQARWLKTQLSESTSPWNVVFMHHAPYSSCIHHGSTRIMQWPYEDWGANVVIAGHDHTYERIMRDDNNDQDTIPYFVTGVGGYTIYDFPEFDFVDGSVYRYKDNYGALLIQADDTSMTFQFYSIDSNGTLIDSLYMKKGPSCCHEITGNIDNVGLIDIADLSCLINYLASEGFILPCPAAADIDKLGGTDINDLAYLVRYLHNRNIVLPQCPPKFMMPK